MAKTVQNVIDAATAQELAFDGEALIPDTVEVLGLLNDRLAEIFRRLGRFVPFYYGMSKIFTSTGGGTARSVDLTDVGAGQQLIEALRLVEREDGQQVYLVEEERKGAQPSPRAYLRGQTMHEVGSEWGGTGAVKFNVLYTRRAAVLDTAGNYSQQIDLPDEWTRPLEESVAGYIARKDGRPQDGEMWDTRADAGISALAAHLSQLHGVEPQAQEPATR